MKKTATILLTTFLTLIVAIASTFITISCSGSKKTPCVIYDTIDVNVNIPVYDTIFVTYPGLEYYENLRDSMEFWAQYFIDLEDSIINIGIYNEQELEKYFEEQQGRLDSSKEHWNDIFNQRADSLLLYALKLDSIKETIRFDYKFTCNDSTRFRVFFDTTMLKVAIVYGPDK